MEIIKHTVTGMEEFEFLSSWLFGIGAEYYVVCDTFNTEYDSIFTFTIKFTEDNIKRDHLEMFNKIFKNDSCY